MRVIDLPHAWRDVPTPPEVLPPGGFTRPVRSYARVLM
jgi:hypothetical protein